MKIFQTDYKINFVDDNNVFVGFDNEQYCCENFGWFFSDKPENGDVEGIKPNLEGYNFDTEYFHSHWSEHFEEGGIVAFRLVNESNDELFLHLYNHHNGYYGHGFVFAIKPDIKIIRKDSL